jgi:hypothetical protein
MKRLITCELHSSSDYHAIQSVYTGFQTLHQLGMLHLQQRVVSEQLVDPSQPIHLQDARRHHLRVILNHDVVLYYDLHDSYEVNAQALEQSDFYFKRSFRPEDKANVFPLGLIYPVYPDRRSGFSSARIRLNAGKEKLKRLLQGAGVDALLSDLLFVPRSRHFGELPNFELPPQVLFMVRAWDPQDMGTPEKQAEYHAVNEMRAECIRSLKREFGSAFLGGFYGDYAQQHYPDLLLDQPQLSKQKQYLKQLQQFPICIATTGLHGSIGWKMAEYVAQSKAIVSEQLCYQVPGDFQAERNYLEFATPDQCVAATARLFEDAGLRSRLIANNFRYYQAYSKPEAIVLNSLAIALEKI